MFVQIISIIWKKLFHLIWLNGLIGSKCICKYFSCTMKTDGKIDIYLATSIKQM